MVLDSHRNAEKPLGFYTRSKRGLMSEQDRSPRSVVYLFVDTNLLVQCCSLGNLDWSDWNEFDEVRLIVSKPVQREIDHLKNRGTAVSVNAREPQTQCFARC